MLKSITLANFKSYAAEPANLPLAPLTVLIGANASGKSNVIEALRLLSFLAQGLKLSTLHFTSQNGERIVRGRPSDWPHNNGDEFTLGCEIDDADYKRLSMTIARREGELHILYAHFGHPRHIRK